MPGRPVPVLPLPEALSPQRGSYMAALSLAEQIISESAAMPTSFSVEAPAYAPTEPTLRFYFHHDLPGLRRFRDEQKLTESMETHGNRKRYFEATGEPIHGVRVSAWTLLDAEEPAAVTA